MEFIQIFIGVLLVIAIIATVITMSKYRTSQANMKRIKQLAKETKQETSQDHERIEETIKQMRVLENRVMELQNIIETAKSQYEGHVSGLYAKVDGLVIALNKANNSLDIANETIAELHKEVKRGNQIIEKLQDKIANLLEEKAENAESQQE